MAGRCFVLTGDPSDDFHKDNKGTDGVVGYELCDNIETAREVFLRHAKSFREVYLVEIKDAKVPGEFWEHIVGKLSP